MRLSAGTLRQVVKRDLPNAFVPQQLTSYGGVELRRRCRIELPRRLRAACAALGGDYGGVAAGTECAWWRRSRIRGSLEQILTHPGLPSEPVRRAATTVGPSWEL